MNALKSLCVCAAAVLVCSVGVRGAISPDWNNDTGGDFLDGTNWIGGAAPVAADDTANFDRGTPNYDVTFTADVTNAGCHVKNDTLTFDLATGRTYTASSTFELAQSSGENGELTVKNGTLDASGVTNIFWFNQAGTGKLTVTGAGSTVKHKWIYSGSGTGTIEVLDGGTLITVYQCRVGGDNASGNYTWLVDGPDSSITVGSTSGGMSVGTKGAGTITIQNGGQMDGGSGWALASNAGSSGTINVGVVGTGTLDGKMSITFGDAGTGAFNIGAGGTVDIGMFTVGANTTVTHAGTMSTHRLDNSGTVALTGGTITGTSSNYDLNVLAGGLLTGSGTLTPYTNRRVMNTGTIAPGTSIGTITITSGTNVDTLDCTGGTLVLEFDDTSCDLIQLTTEGKSIDLDGAKLDFEGSGLTGGETGQHDFLTAGTISGFGTLASNDIDEVMLDLGFAPGTWDMFIEGDPGSGQSLRLTYVPEPAFAVLLLVGLPCVVRRRVRRR